MRATTAGSTCVSNTDLSPNTQAGVGLLCVEDWIPYIDQTCTDNSVISLIKTSADFPACKSNNYSITIKFKLVHVQINV